MNFVRPFQKPFETGLQEDRPEYDWTTNSLNRFFHRGLAKIVAKDDGIFACEDLALELQSSLEIISTVKNGEKFEKGQVLWEIRGSTDIILKIERTFLNLASFTCGIATETKKYVDTANIVAREKTITPPRVTCTRKTLPGLKGISLLAVRAGGGYPHRTDLGAGILIKENHIAMAGSIEAAIQEVKKSGPHGLKLEIEVQNETELKKALEHNADVILLDNFSPENLERAIRNTKSIRAPRVLFEASGGVNLATLPQFVIPGVDVISVGGLTHTVKPCDLSLLVQK